MKSKDRICKYCKFVFANEIEMFVSLNYGHFTCQECFADLRSKNLIP